MWETILPIIAVFYGSLLPMQLGQRTMGRRYLHTQTLGHIHCFYHRLSLLVGQLYVEDPGDYSEADLGDDGDTRSR